VEVSCLFNCCVDGCIKTNILIHTIGCIPWGLLCLSNIFSAKCFWCSIVFKVTTFHGKPFSLIKTVVNKQCEWLFLFGTLFLSNDMGLIDSSTNPFLVKCTVFVLQHYNVKLCMILKTCVITIIRLWCNILLPNSDLCFSFFDTMRNSQSG
jgi:hypothetical protein